MFTLSSQWTKPMLFSLALSLSLCSTVFGQTSDQNQQYSEHLIETLTYRNVGPFRGGRSTTVTGVPGQPFIYYMGTTGGGVWKTTKNRQQRKEHNN